ncbi:MAG: MoxR family ATPase [Deltaproteobacteria bacterium]|nr:MAG: MoxR family ATPase [Deltaproteobacteria bacterium]TMQ19813.1 MAG: MoxR family ATPase [Deltaproteobacteria bacterium]
MAKTPTYRGSPVPRGKLSLEHALLEAYVPGPGVVEVVNLALRLDRPILIKGEPGTGKTRLAQAVAYELKRPYFEWHVKSTSRAQDGLYTFDGVKRLRDAQLAQTSTKAGKAAAARLANPDLTDYITYGELGKAFRSKTPAVVLLDEIDKADIDFPNDLLLELDQGRFLIHETGQWVRATARPLVFITSNTEKDLPDAFLRRCLFHYIDFPDRDELEKIVAAHFSSTPDIVELIGLAVTRFLALRAEMTTTVTGGKRASTSELIDWFRALSSDAAGNKQRLAAEQLPFPSALIKTLADLERVRKKTS